MKQSENVHTCFSVIVVRDPDLKKKSNMGEKRIYFFLYFTVTIHIEEDQGKNSRQEPGEKLHKNAACWLALWLPYAAWALRN